MNISDELLMAYADDELDPAARAELKSAIDADPALAERVSRHRALRARVEAAFTAQLSEDIPQRLLQAARGQSAARSESGVADLAQARAARRAAPRRRLPMVFGIAASLLAALGLGYFVWQSQTPFGKDAGGLVARGALASALTQQLAADPPAGPRVQIGLSYLAKSGEYCRTFALAGSQAAAGIACHQGEQWRVRLVGSASETRHTEYRTAGSPLNTALLDAVQADIAGEPLDSAAEQSARAAGWKEH